MSQSFQIKEGVAHFIIPNQMPLGYDVSQLSVRVSGTVPMGSDGSNLSLHTYEREDEARIWQLGKEYMEKMVDADVPDGTEIDAVFSLPGRDGSTSDHSIIITKRFPANEYLQMEAVTHSYYAWQNSRASQILQSGMLSRMLDQWTDETIVNPKWNVDSFTRYQILNQNMDTTSDEELYYCSFSADSGKQYDMVLRYDPEDGGGLGKVRYSETPYSYDLQANIADITAKLIQTELDLSTAVAERVQVVDASQNSTREAIRLTDGNGNAYLYYFDERTAAL